MKSNKNEKFEERERKLKKAVRGLQKKAARMDEALSAIEQEEDNYLLSLRVEERRAARRHLTAKEVLKTGTPEERAEMIACDFDSLRTNGKGTITPEEKSAIYSSYKDDPENFITFTGYLKLYADLADYTDKALFVYKTLQEKDTLLVGLLTQYESIQRERRILDILFKFVASKKCSGISYNLQDEDKTKEKSLDDETPETFLAEINEAYKEQGVTFRDEISDDGQKHLVADVSFKGGLRDNILDQSKQCKRYLSYTKSYLEPLRDYINKNGYWNFAPQRLIKLIEDVTEGSFSKSIIAPEFCTKEIRGEESKTDAVVPAYDEVETDDFVVRGCYDYLKRKRNEPIKTK